MKKEDRWDDDSDITLKRDFLDKKIDGVSYIKSLIRVKKVGNIYTALCPFHNEKTESLRIYPEGFKNSDGKPQDHTSWFCFGCKKGGDIVKFENGSVMKVVYDFEDYLSFVLEDNERISFMKSGIYYEVIGNIYENPELLNVNK